MTLYSDPIFGISGGLVTPNKAAQAANVEPKNLRNQISQHLRQGKPLPPKLSAKLISSQGRLGEEVRLHTYSSRLIKASIALREIEDKARSRLKMNWPASETEIREAFNEGVSHVNDVFFDTIQTARRLKDKDVDLAADEQRTTVYLAAAARHAQVIIWEEAADAMLRSGLPDNEEVYAGLFFSGSTDRCVSSIAAEAFDAYALAEQALRAMQHKLDGQQSRLIDHDLGIINMNLAAIASHARDWLNCKDYITIIGDLDLETEQRLKALSGSFTKQTLKQLEQLMQQHQHHVLLSRNAAYLALQFDDAELLQKAAKLLGEQLGVKPDEVWSINIFRRERLQSEPAISHKFQDGEPTILRIEEAA